MDMNSKIVASTLCGVAMVAIASAVWIYEGYGTVPEALAGITSWFDGKQFSQLFRLESLLLASPYILLVGGLLFLVFLLFKSRTKGSDNVAVADSGRNQSSFFQVKTDGGGVELITADPASVTTLTIDDLESNEDNGKDAVASEEPLEEPTPDQPDVTSAPRVDPITEAKVYAACGRKSQAIDLLIDVFASDDIDHDAATNELLTLFDQELKNPETSANRKILLQNQREEFLENLSNSEVQLSEDTLKRIQQPDISDDIHNAVA
jgi:hypothetical protein